MCKQLCKRAVHAARQVPCAPDRGFYGGGIVLRVDAFKADASWMRLQAVQTVHPLASISVQTSSEAVVRSPLLCACSLVSKAFKIALETLSLAMFHVSSPFPCPWASAVLIRDLCGRLNVS